MSNGTQTTLVPDHIPQLADDEVTMRRARLAYSIAYIRALIERAEADAA